MFKKKPRPKGASLHRKKPVTVTQEPYSRLGNQWRILGVGFVMGILTTVLFQVLLFVYKSHNLNPQPVKKVHPTVSTSVLAGQKTSAGMGGKQPVFDFYTQLAHVKDEKISPSLAARSSARQMQISPQSAVKHITTNTPSHGTETTVSNTQHRNAPPRVRVDNTSDANIAHANKATSNKVTSNQVTSAKGNDVTERTSSPQTSPQTGYIVQAASLKEEGAANRLKKNMALWGLTAQIKQVRGKEGLWYRVQSGPFSTLQSAKDAQNVLVLHGLKGLLIRQ